MNENSVNQLLRDARRLLLRPWLYALYGRSLARAIEGYLRAAQRLTGLGNAVIARARATASTIRYVSIDPEERETRAHTQGIEVKAWLLVPDEEIAVMELADPTVDVAFSGLDRLTQEVVALRFRYDLDLDTISHRLHISRARARRLLRRGINTIARAFDDRDNPIP